MLPAPINNPSVLTGMPVNIGSVPTGNTVAAYYGAVPAPQASYNAAAAYQMQLPATPVAQAAYYAPQAPASSGCGLLGHIFGNRYQTNYNNVPTTVYRPVQQLNPTTGQTVIVQQPCTTTTQQVQRTPYTSLQPAQPATVAPALRPTTASRPVVTSRHVTCRQLRPLRCRPSRNTRRSRSTLPSRSTRRSQAMRRKAMCRRVGLRRSVRASLKLQRSRPAMAACRSNTGHRCHPQRFHCKGVRAARLNLAMPFPWNSRGWNRLAPA